MTDELTPERLADLRNALDALVRERNTWARSLADMRDERDTAITERDEARAEKSEATNERDVLTVEVERLRTQFAEATEREEAQTLRAEKAEATLTRVRSLTLSTDGDDLDPDFDGNTVGDIRRALDGGRQT